MSDLKSDKTIAPVDFQFIPIPKEKLEERKEKLEAKNAKRKDKKKKLSATEQKKILSKLIQAIKDKDIQEVNDCLEYDIKITGRVEDGKTLAQIVAENFSKDIADHLDDYGMGTPFPHSLFRTCIQKDDPEALNWFIPKREDVFHDKGERLMANAADIYAFSCLRYLIKKDKQKNESKDLFSLPLYNVKSVLTKSLNKEQWQMFDLFLLLANNKKVGHENLFKKWLLYESNNFDYNTCLKLVNHINDNKNLKSIWKNIFPMEVTLYGSLSNSFDPAKLNFTKKHKSRLGMSYGTRNQYSYYDKSDIRVVKMNYFVEMLILKNSKALTDILLVPKGKETIVHLLQDKPKLETFLFSNSQEQAKKVLASCYDDLKKWRDSEGNNLGHYLMATSSTKAMFNYVYSLDKGLCQEKNQYGISSLHVLDEKDKSYAMKRLMRKTLNEMGTGLTKNTNKAKKRINKRRM